MKHCINIMILVLAAMLLITTVAYPQHDLQELAQKIDRQHFYESDKSPKAPREKKKLEPEGALRNKEIQERREHSEAQEKELQERLEGGEKEGREHSEAQEKELQERLEGEEKEGREHSEAQEKELQERLEGEEKERREHNEAQEKELQERLEGKEKEHRQGEVHNRQEIMEAREREMQERIERRKLEEHERELFKEMEEREKEQNFQRDERGRDGKKMDRKHPGDIVRIFGSARLEKDERANDVVLVFSEGTIKGRINGDCVVIGSRLHLKKGARINKDLISVFSTIDKSQDVKINGDQVIIASYETPGLPVFFSWIFSSWDLLLAVLLLLFWWRHLHSLTDRFLMNPASSFLTGFLGLLGFIPAIILLALSIVGILIIPLIPLFYTCGFILGFAIAGNLLGGKLFQIVEIEMKQPLKSILGLLAILILVKVISLFPLLGGLTAELIKMLIRTAGLGLLLLIVREAANKMKK